MNNGEGNESLTNHIVTVVSPVVKIGKNCCRLVVPDKFSLRFLFYFWKI